MNVVCHTCFKRQEKLHRCGQCKFAHYCDRTCQKDAWLNHKNECSAIKRYGKVPNENIRSELGPGVGTGIPKCQAGDGGRDSMPRSKQAGMSANQERVPKRQDMVTSSMLSLGLGSPSMRGSPLVELVADLFCVAPQCLIF